jgi:hypothetical protein
MEDSFEGIQVNIGVHVSTILNQLSKNYKEAGYDDATLLSDIADHFDIDLAWTFGGG